MAKKSVTDVTESGQGFADEDKSADYVDNENNTIPLESLRIKTIQLRELGDTLPVGINLNGVRLTDFKIRPFRAEYDRILGQMLKRNGRKLISVMSDFLPEIIDGIGGYGIKELASKLETSPKKLIENMPLGDVLTLILGARSASQGSQIAMSATCPRCNTKNDDDPEAGEYHDLSSIEIDCVENDFSGNKLIVEVTLKDGLKVFDDKIMKIWMQPIRLYHAELIGKANKNADDVSMLYSMVCGMPECSAYHNTRGQMFGDELYNELSREDLAILRKAMKVIQPGPKMQIEMECFNCGFEWEESVNWGNLREFLYVSYSSNR